MYQLHRDVEQIRDCDYDDDLPGILFRVVVPSIRHPETDGLRRRRIADERLVVTECPGGSASDVHPADDGEGHRAVVVGEEAQLSSVSVPLPTGSYTLSIGITVEREPVPVRTCIALEIDLDLDVVRLDPPCDVEGYIVHQFGCEIERLQILILRVAYPVIRQEIVSRVRAAASEVVVSGDHVGCDLDISNRLIELAVVEDPVVVEGRVVTDERLVRGGVVAVVERHLDAELGVDDDVLGYRGPHVVHPDHLGVREPAGEVLRVIEPL